MNAFTFEMIDAWTAALQQCRTDDAVKVVLVTGTGSSFCSGGDIVEMGDRLEHTPEQRKNELFHRIERIPLALEDLDKPVIAAVNGVATGAGMDMALMCDIRYAAQSARFAETYVKVGLVPGAGGAHFLPRLVGVSKALELFLTGDFIDAQEALRIGIVNKVFPDETLARGSRQDRAPDGEGASPHAAHDQAGDLSGDAQRFAHQPRSDLVALRRHHLDSGAPGPGAVVHRQPRQEARRVSLLAAGHTRARNVSARWS